MPGAGRPKGSITIADHSLLLQMATAAARHYPEVIAFWLEILHGVHKGSNKKYSTAERLEASDRIMAYGFGKPPQAIMGHFTEARKQVLEVRWLPPDQTRKSCLRLPHYKLDLSGALPFSQFAHLAANRRRSPPLHVADRRLRPFFEPVLRNRAFACRAQRPKHCLGNWLCGCFSLFSRKDS
jgi:hypothetical protein